MTPAQSRMARAALRWTLREFARRVGLTTNTICAFEGGRNVHTETVAKMRRLFEKHGADFSEESTVKMKVPV